METYSSNSNKSKNERTEEKKDQQINTHTVQPEKNAVTKLRDVFGVTDFKTVGEYMIFDLLVPKVKTLLYETLSGGLTNLCYGKKGVKAPSSTSHLGDIDYSRSSSIRPVEASTYSSKHSAQKAVLDIQNECIFDTFDDADLFIDKMYDILRRYHWVRVADAYDLVGMRCPYTANNYGWDSLEGIEALATDAGEWQVKFPPIVPVNSTTNSVKYGR